MWKVEKLRRYFKAIKREKEQRKFRIAAWDLETEGLGGKLLCATWCLEDSEPQIIFGTPEEIIIKLVEVFRNYKDYRWYAHNAQYDWRYIIDYLISEYKDNINFFLRTDNDVFLIKTIDFELADSFAIWPHSLKTLTEAFSTQKQKLDIGEEIKHFDIHNIKHINYALRDAQALAISLANYDQFVYDNFQVHLSYTVASTSLRAWKATLKPGEQYVQDNYIEKFIRSAYFGGYVAVGSIQIHKNVKSFDRNSAYSFVMREYGVPYGKYRNVKHFNPNLNGIYDVTVTTPNDLVFPILPLRIQNGKQSHILWNRGTFRTTVTSLELNLAIEHGYIIEEIHEGKVWEETVFPFTEFVDKCEYLRSVHKNTPLETVIKLIQNSLYGKFGARRERRMLFIPKTKEEFMGAEPWGDSDTLYTKVEEAEVSALPLWAVWITARERVDLISTIYEIGVDKVLYCDTDSITTTAEFVGDKIGNEYGKFKLEKSYELYKAIAPKVYVGITKHGEFLGACKGIPIKRKDPIEAQSIFIQLFETSKTIQHITSLPSFVGYMKGNRENKEIDRKSTDVNNSSSWCIENEEIVPRIYAAN